MAEFPPATSGRTTRRRNRIQPHPGHRPAEQGMLASTLGTTVLLLFGSAALVAGSLNWQAASSRGGDAEQAREAAEWGFNSLMDRLNEPGNNYLLVTNWAAATNPPSWLDSAAQRSSCGITTDNRGAVPVAQLISATQTVGGRQVRYRLTDFVPPQYPNSTAPAALPQVCKDNFGNLAGGTVRFTVVGEVLQNGTVVASHSIDRTATVDSVEGDGFGGGAPASPPMTFLATGSGRSGLVSFDTTGIGNRAEFIFDSNANWRGDGGDERRGQIYCLVSCAGSGDLRSMSTGARRYELNELSTADFLKAFPSAPPYSSELNSLSTLTIGDGSSPNNALGIGGDGIPGNFPYKTSGELLDQCREVTLPTLAGPGERVIGCRVRLNIGTKDREFVVNTSRSKLPVVLYLIGTNEHKIAEGGKIVNSQFRSDAQAKIQDTTSWSMLRIYGDPSNNLSFQIQPSQTARQLEQCKNNDTQSIKFEKNVYVQGAVIWIPKGKILFEEHPNKWSPALFGTVWTCEIKFGSRVTVYNNTDPIDVSKGLDAAFGLIGGAPARYSARGVERNQ